MSGHFPGFSFNVQHETNSKFLSFSLSHHWGRTQKNFFSPELPSKVWINVAIKPQKMKTNSDILLYLEKYLLLLEYVPLCKTKLVLPKFLKTQCTHVLSFQWFVLKLFHFVIWLETRGCRVTVILFHPLLLPSCQWRLFWTKKLGFWNTGKWNTWHFFLCGQLRKGKMLCFWHLMSSVWLTCQAPLPLMSPTRFHYTALFARVTERKNLPRSAVGLLFFIIHRLCR